MLDTAVLKVGQPATIKPGDIWLEPVAKIRTKFSIDYAVPDGSVIDAEVSPLQESWDAVLEKKRDDANYPDILDSIRVLGFVRPVTVRPIDGGTDYRYGDGHHRLAAAIDLGLAAVPVEAVAASDDYGCCSEDSGMWEAGDDIPEVNLPGEFYCGECGVAFDNDVDALFCAVADTAADVV